MKKTATQDSSQSAPSFEEALAALEKVVAAMESESLPLDDMITSFEDGSRLLSICRRRLDQARQRVEAITRREDGEPALAPLDNADDDDDQPADSLF